MSWFKSDEYKNIESMFASLDKPTVYPFWMREGETKDLYFLDNGQFVANVHKFQHKGRWETYTCAGPDCLFCSVKKPRTTQEYFTVLDMTPFTSKNGKEYAYSRRFLAAPKSVSLILNAKRQELGGSLVGKRFRVTRVGEKSPGSGNSWVHLADAKPADPNSMPDYLKPLDFESFLEPMSTNEMKDILGIVENTQLEKFAPKNEYNDLPF